MKKYFFTILLLAVVLFCSAQGKHSLITQKVIKDSISSDSCKYEIIITEPGFNSWFETNRKPKWFYSKSYLKYWDYIYTVNWNMKNISERGNINNPFYYYIDYNYNIDYGKEVYYKLYYYFKYIEYKYHKKIYPYKR
ncbi:MAG: hypothetical protein J7J86_06705 [Bacteroidales bacterium]|nr:hypothetical protein [Bacteroidales bacterium]